MRLKNLSDITYLFLNRFKINFDGKINILD